jgi:translation initiation factor 2B subunit (eIF-2B alpha/beta/delta family)
VPDSKDIGLGVVALGRDRTSGATALARRAARLLWAAAQPDSGKSLARWQQDVRATGLAIVDAQPTMGSLLTVVDLTFQVAERAQSVPVGVRAVRCALDRWQARQPAAVARAAGRLAAVLPPRARCLTLSSSEVVRRALVTARRGGRLAEVVVAESRPGGEGLVQAWRLGAAGVPTVVVADGLAAAMVAEVDVVVVGADAVSRAALWHKCGTLALALAARAARRPFLVVTTSDRLVAAPLARRLRVTDVEPEVVPAGRAPRVRALTRLFDVTPLRLVTRVVTEHGAASPARVRASLVGRPMSRWW